MIKTNEANAIMNLLISLIAILILALLALGIAMSHSMVFHSDRYAALCCFCHFSCAALFIAW